MATINQIQRPPSDMEQLSQAIGIAGGIYGIISKSKELDLQKATANQHLVMAQNQLAKENREAQASQNKDFEQVPEGSPLALPREQALAGSAPGFQLAGGMTLRPRAAGNELNKTKQEKMNMLNGDYKAASLKTDEALTSYKGYKELYNQAKKDPNGMNGFGLATAAFQTINPGYALRDFEYGKIAAGSINGGDFFNSVLTKLKGGNSTLDEPQINQMHAMVTAKMAGTLENQMDIDKDIGQKAIDFGFHPNDVVNTRYKKVNDEVHKNLADINTAFDKANIAKNKPVETNTAPAPQTTYQPGTKLFLKNGTTAQINPDGKTYTIIGNHTLGQQNAPAIGGR